MNKNIPVYDLTLTDSTTSGVFAISLVDYPAIEEDFIYFDTDKMKLSAVNEDKMMITGAVLIPDINIYRFDETRGEYYIRFSAESIKAFAQKFLKEKRNDSFTLFHEYPVDSISIVESYFLDDNKKFNDLPNGTWMITAKVNDSEIWNTIKNTSLLNGFSVEISGALNKVEMSKQIKETNLLSDLLEYLGVPKN